MECISATVPTGHRLGMLYFGASCKARRAGSETSMSRRSSEVSDQPERQAKASKSNYEMKTSRTRREGRLWRASLAWHGVHACRQYLRVCHAAEWHATWLVGTAQASYDWVVELQIRHASRRCLARISGPERWNRCALWARSQDWENGAHGTRRADFDGETQLMRPLVLCHLQGTVKHDDHAARRGESARARSAILTWHGRAWPSMAGQVSEGCMRVRCWRDAGASTSVGWAAAAWSDGIWISLLHEALLGPNANSRLW